MSHKANGFVQEEQWNDNTAGICLTFKWCKIGQTVEKNVGGPGLANQNTKAYSSLAEPRLYLRYRRALRG